MSTRPDQTPVEPVTSGTLPSTAEHCGREDYDMCTPAEFNALRVDRIHQLMLEELNLGRRLFRLRTLFRSEENPMGFPRAAAAPDRDFLEAFPLD